MPHTQIRAILATTALGLLLTGCVAAPQYSPAEQEMSETMGKDSFQPATRALRDSIETQELLAQAAFWMREYELNPADLEAAIKLSAAVRKVGNPQRAVEITQTTRALYPKDPYLTAEYAAALIASERAGDAMEPLDQALAYAPAYGRLWSLKGAALDQQERYDLARKHYAHALKITPNDPSVMANMGLSYALSGDPRSAENWLRRASAVPGASKSVHQNLALVLQIQGKTDEADKIARRAATQSSGKLPELNTQPAHTLRGAIPATNPQNSAYSSFKSAPPKITTSNSPSARASNPASVQAQARNSAMANTARQSRTYPPQQQTKSAPRSYPSQQAASAPPIMASPPLGPQGQAKVYQGAKSASEAARMAAQQSSRRSQTQTVTPVQKQAQDDILARLASNVGARAANPALAHEMQKRYARNRQQQDVRRQAVMRQGLRREGVMARQARMAPTPQQAQQPYYPGRQQQPAYNPYQHPTSAPVPHNAQIPYAPQAQIQRPPQGQGQAYPPQNYAPQYNPNYAPTQAQQPMQLRGAARQRR